MPARLSAGVETTLARRLNGGAASQRMAGPRKRVPTMRWTVSRPSARKRASVPQTVSAPVRQETMAHYGTHPRLVRDTPPPNDIVWHWFVCNGPHGERFEWVLVPRVQLKKRLDIERLVAGRVPRLAVAIEKQIQTLG